MPKGDCSAQRRRKAAITASTSGRAEGSGTEVTSITVAEKELPNSGPVGVIDSIPWSIARSGPGCPRVQVLAGQNQANRSNRSQGNVLWERCDHPHIAAEVMRGVKTADISWFDNAQVFGQAAGREGKRMLGAVDREGGGAEQPARRALHAGA